MRCIGFSGQSDCLFKLVPGGGKAAREALPRPRADAVAHPRMGFRLSLRFQSGNFSIFSDSRCGSVISLLRLDHLLAGPIGRSSYSALVRRQVSSSTFQKLRLCLN